jgi:RAB protein geranylgeranyltransferase component A
VVKPHLLEQLNQSYPDPTKIIGVDRKEQFLYEAELASMYKKVVGEFLVWIQNWVDQAQHLEKKQKGEIKDFGIGRGD